MIDHYAVLGLGPSAEQIVVKAAYRALAMEYHPDRVGDDEATHKRMAEVNAAYEVLGDPDARSAYDEEYEEAQRRGKPPSMPPELPSDWDIAAEYYPEIQVASDELEIISPVLASAFRVEILRKRAFSVADRVLPKKMLLDFFKREYSDAKGIWDVLVALRLIGKDAAIERLLIECKITGVPSRVWGLRGRDLISELGVRMDPKKQWYQYGDEKPTAARLLMLKWVVRENYKGEGEPPWWMMDVCR